MNFTRFAAGSVALAAALAGLAFTTGTAHASGTGFCLDANARQAYNFGGIIQWQCDDSDNYQNWTVTTIANPPGDAEPDGIMVQIKNNGTGLCLDADAQQMDQGGKVIQWQCDSSDPYQVWIMKAVDNGAAVRFESYAAWYSGPALCLDANAQQTYDFGTIAQWPCSDADPYQQWATLATDNNVLQNVGASA